MRVPKEKQKQAVTFLLQNALTTPTKLLNPAVLSQIRYSGVADEIAGQQKSVLLDLLSASRLSRLLDAEVLAPDKTYTAIELMADLQAGIWSELKAEHPKVDPLRRGLQRAYLDRLKGELDSKDSAAAVRPARGSPVGIARFEQDDFGGVTEGAGPEDQGALGGCDR